MLVVPVRLGADPYGFFGKSQAVTGVLERPKALADSLARTLLKNPQTFGEMKRAAVSSLAGATSNPMAQTISRLLVEAVPEVTDEEKASLWHACANNAHVADADGVTDAIYAKFGRPRVTTSAEPPPDDDIPF